MLASNIISTLEYDGIYVIIILSAVSKTHSYQFSMRCQSRLCYNILY